LIIGTRLSPSQVGGSIRRLRRFHRFNLQLRKVAVFTLPRAWTAQMCSPGSRPLYLIGVIYVICG